LLRVLFCCAYYSRLVARIILEEVGYVCMYACTCMYIYTYIHAYIMYLYQPRPWESCIYHLHEISTIFRNKGVYIHAYIRTCTCISLFASPLGIMKTISYASYACIRMNDHMHHMHAYVWMIICITCMLRYELKYLHKYLRLALRNCFHEVSTIFRNKGVYIHAYIRTCTCISLFASPWGMIICIICMHTYEWSYASYACIHMN
jgi:hypothetical protein